INLRRIGRSINLSEKAQARVTTEGPFTIPGGFNDDYWLDVRPPAGFYVKAATLGSADVTRTPFRPIGADLRVTLANDGPTLSVQAVDADNHTVSSAIVVLGQDSSPDRQFPLVISRMTDIDGQAVFSGIGPGEYRLFALRWTSPTIESAAMDPGFFR